MPRRIALCDDRSRIVDVSDVSRQMQYAPSRLLVDGRPVGPVVVAQSYLARARGLLLTRGVDGALLLSPGNSVHGLGMTYALDVAQLDADLRVLRVAALPPFGVVGPRRGVRHVLEAERGAFARWGLGPGSRLGIRRS